MKMTQPRRDTPADDAQIDRVREALRDHDERLEQDSEGTERNRQRDGTDEPEERRGREQAEDAGET
jgi:hypothetical protein